MTFPSSSRAASSYLSFALLVVIFGCLAADISACGGVPSAAKNASATSLISATKGGHGGRATDEGAAAATSFVEWPEGMAGLWSGSYLASALGSGLEGVSIMAGEPTP